MAQKSDRDDNKKHKTVHNTKGQRVSSCGNYIYMQDGSKFRRTILPSVVSGLTSLDDVLDELEKVDAISAQEKEE